MLSNISKFIKDRTILFGVSLILISTVLVVQLWNREIVQHRTIYWDTISYYAYLPASFIHGDPGFRFMNEGVERDSNKTWLYWTSPMPNGKQMVKMTMGWAILNIPAFIMAHGFAKIFGFSADGFSTPYHVAIGLNNSLFACFGLYYLWLLLSRFFRPMVRDLCLVILSLGTNLYYYSSWTQPGSHIYEFFLIAFFIEYSFRIASHQKFVDIALAGFAFGLIVLIRPIDLLIIAIPFYQYVDHFQFDRFKKLNHISLLKQVLIFSFSAFLMVLPQLVYWKWVSGHWFYWSYVGEKFFFNRPMVYEFLFSYRKGWLLYSPLLLVGILGFWVNHINTQKFRTIALFFTLGIVYLNSCWWSWWFGGGFGARTMIDFYPILAIPIAAGLEYLFNKNSMFKLNIALIVGFLVFLSCFQTRQKEHGLIHYDAMTREAYWNVFLKNRFPKDYDKLINPPDYEAAMRGEVVR